MYAQCDILILGMPDYICDNGGTVGDISDDTYTATLTAFNNGDDILWNPTYGPFNIVDGVQMVTVVHPSDPSCTLIYTITAPAHCDPFICPDYNVCVDLIAEDGCTALYYVNFDILSPQVFTLSDLIFNFNVSGGDIVSFDFLDPTTNIAMSGITLNDENSTISISGGTNILSTDLDAGSHFSLVVSGAPGPCVIISRQNATGMFFDGMPCIVNQNCPDNMDFCPTGETIQGQITTLSNSVGPCPNTQGLGIEGAEVTISNTNGSCNSVSDISGRYGCTLCEDDSYDICVTTTCDEPCGLENIDLMIMQQILVGGAITAEVIFKGDLDQDGSFSAFDRGLANKKLMGQDVSQHVSTWCRFVPLDDYTDAVNGIQVPGIIDDCFTTTDPSTAVDYLRFVLGDFNGSCDDCTHNDGTGPFPITIEQGSEHAFVIADEDVDVRSLIIDFSIEDISKIFTVDSELEGMSYAIVGQQLKVTWLPDAASAKTLRKGDVLLSINGNLADQNIRIEDDHSFLLGGDNEILSLDQNEYRIANHATHKFLSIRNQKDFPLDPRSENVNIRLYTLNGALLSNENLVLNVENNYYELHQDHINNGLYIINIETEYDKISQKVIIVND
jgi:hypothetical protein